MVKPLEVEYKPGQEFIPVPAYYPYPSTDYNYNLLQPQQPSVIQATPYSTTTTPYHLSTTIDYTNNNSAAAPTSTADLYSSTYAMLSADGITSQPDWSYAIPEKPPTEQYPSESSYPISQQQVVPQIIHNIYQPQQQQQPGLYHDPNNTILYPYNYQVYYDQSFPSTSAEPQSVTTMDLKNRQLSNNVGISGRSAQAAFSESFRKIAKIPKNNNGCEQQSCFDGDDERVMCLACKGVHTSRRSLTGHIGRNEKCREIIGRTYLDSLVQTGQSDILPDPNSIEGGISPICPNCNRFISHYKGNIRRHVNQCVKRPSKSSASSSGQPSPNTVNSVAEHYAAMAPIVTKDNPAYHQISPESEQDNNNILINPFEQCPSSSTTTSFNHSSISTTTTKTSSTTGIPSKKTGKISAVAVQSTNPYSCSWCKFTTVYKGNMKRHLISVHNCTDEILRRISFDLERLRALAPNRPITPLAPQPEKIRGCSGRRRKCRPKNEKCDDSKRAKLLGENEIPPTAVSDVVASFASSINHNNINKNILTPYSITDEILVPISSLDSGISSGGSIDEC
uniref:C2H2-type domain-containing protein n=1 Tax=Panagrolaimus superbus TaxID=310955 RepID=A0A914YFL2_9BILA